MNLYLISQTENQDYDTFDSAVVAAPDEQTARKIKPNGLVFGDESVRPWKVVWGDDMWCKSPDYVTAEYIGTTDRDAGVILASFNAG